MGQQDKRRPDAVKTTHAEQKAAAAKQDGDERAESQPQRRRRCMAVCPGCGYILNDEDATRCRRCCAAFFEPSDDGVSANDTEVELPVLFGEACAALGRGDQEHENPVLRSGDRNQRAHELRQRHRRRKKTKIDNWCSVMVTEIPPYAQCGAPIARLFGIPRSRTTSGGPSS